MFEAVKDIFVEEAWCQSENEAEMVIQDQMHAWYDLLGLMSPFQGKVVWEKLREIFAPLTLSGNELDRPFGRRYVPERHGFVVRGIVPLIRRNPESDEFFKKNPDLGTGVILAEGGRILLFKLQRIDVSFDAISLVFNPAVVTAAAGYLIEKHLGKVLPTVGEAIRQGVAKHSATFDEQSRKSAGLLATLDQEKSEWKAFKANAEEEIKAIKASVVEAETLQGARDIWARKSRSHGRIFWSGLLVLTLVIGGGLALLLWHWRDVLGAIPLKPDGDIAYGIVALIALPIIGIAWLLRIVARLVTNSLTLNEDAQQRKAMLETYFRLVADPTAKMEQTDRILILNAIFRPLPGHQMEEVSPPTIADLIQERIGKKEK